MNDNDHLAGQLIDCRNGSIEEAYQYENVRCTISTIYWALVLDL